MKKKIIISTLIIFVSLLVFYLLNEPDRPVISVKAVNLNTEPFSKKTLQVYNKVKPVKIKAAIANNKSLFIKKDINGDPARSPSSVRVNFLAKAKGFSSEVFNYNDSDLILDYYTTFDNKLENSEFEKLGGRKLFKIVDDSKFGVLVKKGRVGNLSGEIVFSNNKKNDVLKIVNRYKLSPRFIDDKMNIYVYKLSDRETIKKLLADNDFLTLNAKFDAQFYKFIPQ